MRVSRLFIKRTVSGYVILSMFLAFFLFMVPPAHETPVVNHTASNLVSSGASFTSSLPLTAASDFLIVGVDTTSPCAASCQTAPDITATVADDKGTDYKLVTSQDVTCPGSCI